MPNPTNNDNHLGPSGPNVGLYINTNAVDKNDEDKPTRVIKFGAIHRGLHWSTQNWANGDNKYL